MSVTRSRCASRLKSLRDGRPAAWSGWNFGVCRDDESGVGFVIVDNVVSDPCDPTQPHLVPPVGPSVDDLVTAISNLAGFEATDPVDVTVDGFRESSSS